MTREEIIEAYEGAVFSSGLSAAAGNEEAAKDYELLKAGLGALRGPTREMVERMRGEWIWDTSGLYPKPVCSKCGEEPYRRSNHTSDLPDYCPKCGQPKTDEAVDMMLERWKEALHEIPSAT